jgi:hypothetical protein
MYHTMGMLVPSLSFRFGIGVWMFAIIDGGGGKRRQLLVQGFKASARCLFQLRGNCGCSLQGNVVKV